MGPFHIVTLTEMRRPARVFAGAAGRPVVIFRRNRLVGCILPTGLAEGQDCPAAVIARHVALHGQPSRRAMS